MFDYNKRTYIMGILNVTPDSFSDGGKFNSIDEALRHALEMVEEGADIIDLGGESTRPGHIYVDVDYVDVDEELKRVIPVVKKLKEELDTPISVDTYKAKVADESLKLGAEMINDIWGLRKDKDMAVLRSINIAIEAGIDKNKIVLDPGIGFGKTYEQNLEVLKRLGELKTLGYPILLGTSRKSVIGNTLDLPPQERVEGTIATTVLGIRDGVDIVRVHDVEKNLRAAKM
ncbi:MAG: dihydropteroate synthase, partial [Romboutsia timonensis]|uniref:dihydropteroate synthase n=1 Tax=Romboutsia timonensis TaxID=1776391 RepID=UPI0039A2D6A8